MKKIAVVLTGCGNQDGSEITEAVSALIAISQNGAIFECFAPSVEFQSKNFLSQESTGSRNTFVESARIARSRIKDISELHSKDFDALVFPGGSGAALYLSNWATHGARAEVHPEARRVVESFYAESKPIGAICIAPTLIAKVLGKHNVSVTLGESGEAAKEVEKTGAHHEVCPVTDFITDRGHKVITTPAYMYGDANPAEVFQGISGLIKELVEMA
jgi:enhancing lycopene biosynthesis protein 2